MDHLRAVVEVRSNTTMHGFVASVMKAVFSPQFVSAHAWPPTTNRKQQPDRPYVNPQLVSWLQKANRELMADVDWYEIGTFTKRAAKFFQNNKFKEVRKK